MTYKAWLLYMIQVNHDADIACAKALRHLLQVKMYFGLFFYLKPKPFGNSFGNSETVRTLHFLKFSKSKRLKSSETVTFRNKTDCSGKVPKRLPFRNLKKPAIFRLLQANIYYTHTVSEPFRTSETVSFRNFLL